MKYKVGDIVHIPKSEFNEDLTNLCIVESIDEKYNIRWLDDNVLSSRPFEVLDSLYELESNYTKKKQFNDEMQEIIEEVT